MLNWAIDCFYYKEHQNMGADIFSYVNEAVACIPPGCDGLYATPWLFGEQFPILDSAVRSVFFNISEGHTRAHFVAAVMEGVCFSLRWQASLCEKDTGIKLESVGANGGGTLSAVWMQMLANILQVPVRVPEAAPHSGAVGAAFATAVGIGWYQYCDIEKFIHTEHIYIPDPTLKELYDNRYQTFTKIYDAVKDLYSTINRKD